MRIWPLRLAMLVGVVVLGVAAYAAYIGYRLYFHGPGALERMEVSAPVQTVRYGASPLQAADLRLPDGPGPFPVVVLIHGGCWDNGFGVKAQMAPLADALGKRGLATLNVEYRQVGDQGGGWPGTMRDVGAALDSLNGLAQEHRLNLGKVTVVGHSAGAQLALWTAMRDRLSPSSDLFSPDPVKPTAVVAVDGPGTLAEFIGVDAEVCGKPVIVPFMGGTPKQFPQRYIDASPQDHLPLGIPQSFAQALFADRMQPYIDRSKAAGDPVEVFRPTDGKHFDIVNPTQKQGQGTIDLIARAAVR